MTYTDLEYEKMTTSGSPGHKPLYPSAHIGEHSSNVHPSGFALLLMICAISTPVSISINDRSNRESRQRNWLVETMQMAGILPELFGMDTLDQCHLQEAGQRSIPIKEIKDAKKKKK